MSETSNSAQDTERALLPQAKLLLPQIVAFKKNNNGFKATGAVLPSILEQLVITGATTVVIRDVWRYEDTLSGIPEYYRKYIEITDQAARAGDITLELLSQVYEELDIEVDDGAGWAKRNPDLSDETYYDAMYLFYHLHEFVIATLCRAQLHMDIDYILGMLRRLFLALKTNDARAQIACLIPIFTCYRKTNVPGIALVDPDMVGLQDRFFDLIRTADYDALSRSRFSLGIGRAIDVIKSEISHRVRKILSTKPAKPLVGYSSGLVSAATGIPIPANDVIYSLMKGNFLPPAVDISNQIDLAKKRAQESYQDLIFTIKLNE